MAKIRQKQALERGAGRVIRLVSIGGFLARVEPGTRFELEEMPVGSTSGFRATFR
jgi:hypothetical protein